jgi:outer membrane protein insertion porin family
MHIFRLSILVGLFLIPISLALPSETFAQSTAQVPAISYQGLKVAAVELAGRPGLDVQQLRKMIYQPVDEPYSQQKIDETVAALKKTGQFSDVTSMVMPEAKGLKVLIVLHPAVYFGMYDFGMAVNRFSYSRLLLTADYPRQEPYTASRVEEARSNLLNFFHQNGYFRAAITPALKTDKNAVNVFFNVDLGKHAKFGKIILLEALRTKKGNN